MDNDNLPISDPIDNLPPPFIDPSDNLIPPLMDPNDNFPPPPPPPFIDPSDNFLIFPDNLETLSDITTILFISDEITDYNLFYDSVNSSTFPIVYSAFRSSKTSVNEVLTKFTSIQRIGFAFHSSSGNEKIFLDRTSLFTDPDISNENVDWLLQVIKDYNVKNVDFLACDSLLYENWVKYFNLLHSETGVIVGASNDKTGNIKYGGDWVLESTGEDVELIYFTTNIEYYKNLLYTAIIGGINYELNDSTLIAYVASNFGVVFTGSIIIPATISYNGKTYNVTSIGGGGFQNCRAGNATLTIPNSVTRIDTFAFYSAQFLSITIPSSVTSFGSSVFAVAQIGTIILSDGTTSILNEMFYGATISNLTIPGSVTRIGNSAFIYATISNLTIPDSVTSIGNSAFSYLTISNLTIPGRVASFGSQPFSYSNIINLTLQSGITTINNNMFAYSNIINITLPDSITFMGRGAFSSSTLGNLTLPSNLISIPYDGFYMASALSVKIPDGLTRIEEAAFGRFNIRGSNKSLKIPNTVTRIDQRAFDGSNFESITLPSGLTNLPYGVFANCSNLKNILIPSGVTSALNSLFSQCTNLKTVIFPPNLTFDDGPPLYNTAGCFFGCPNLRYVTFGSNCTGINSALYYNTFPPNVNYSFKNTSYLPKMVIRTGYPFAFLPSTAYYKSGVLPPSGQGTDPAAYLRNAFNSTIAQIIDPPQLPITATTTWHLLSSVTVNGITFTPAYANTGLVYLPYTNSSINPTVTAINSDPFSIITDISGITNLTPNAYNNIQITVTSNEYNTYTWSVPVFVSGPSCFLEGSRILCLLDNQEKYVPVEKIRKGTLVKTLSSGYKPVDMIGHAKVYNSGDSARIKNRLFRCSKKNYPELFEDLIITGCHSILVGDITEEQRAKSIEYNNDIYITENRYRLIACLDDRADPYEIEGDHPIWHLALENDDIYMNYGIFANGLLVETASKRMMKEYSGMELLELGGTPGSP